MKKLLFLFVASGLSMFNMNTALSATTAFKTQTWETTNGARVVFHQAMEVPMLDISVAFAAGSAFDDTQFGLSALTTRLLDQGNGGLTAGAIADQFAEIGAQYGGASSHDAIVVNLRTLTQPDALDKATQLFFLLLNHPDFPKEAFLREKNQQVMAIAQNHESPDVIADETFYQVLYGQHPYAHPINGTLDTVKDISINDVRHFYQHYFVGKNAVVILVGAIDSVTAHKIAERITHDLPQGAPAQTIPVATPLPEERTIEVKHPSSQSVLRIGQLGITHSNEHYFPLQVGSYILGGGSLVSRLADELREKRGLTYGVSSQFLPMPARGPFLISFSTKNSQRNTALSLTRETLASFIKTGPKEDELIAAKRYLTGSFPLSLASNRSIADMLLKIAFYHLPNDFINTYIDNINAVSIDDITHAFQQQVNPNAMLQVTVGPV
jgi:zinc protease